MVLRAWVASRRLRPGLSFDGKDTSTLHRYSIVNPELPVEAKACATEPGVRRSAFRTCCRTRGVRAAFKVGCKFLAGDEIEFLRSA